MIGVIPTIGDRALLQFFSGVMFSKAKRHSAVRSFRWALGRPRSARTARASFNLVSLLTRLPDYLVYLGLRHSTAVFLPENPQDIRAWVLHVLQVGGVDLSVT